MEACRVRRVCCVKFDQNLFMKLFRTLLLALSANMLWAHPMPNSLIGLHLGAQELLLTVKIPLGDVETAVFQANPESEAWKGLPVRDALNTYFSRHIRMEGQDGSKWSVQLIRCDTTAVNDPLLGPYKELDLQFRTIAPNGADLRQFLLYYDAILHQIVTHQAILSIAQDWANGIDSEQPKILAVIATDPSNGEILPVSVSLDKGSVWKGFFAMIRLGMRHIAEGYDHLLFLLLLILVAPLSAQTGRWVSAEAWRYGLRRLIGIVTAFTIGHTFTLALCTLGIVQVSGRWVEITIAVSIFISAINSLIPLFFHWEMWIAAGFGLIHGMAFSDTLRKLALNKTELVWSLLGFNLGIEAFQLGLVFLVAPLLFGTRKTRAYPYFRMLVGILGVGISLYWIWERMQGGL